MTRLSKRILHIFSYTRKRNSNAIDIRTLGKTVDEITKEYLSLLDFNTFYRIIKFSVNISDKILPSPAEIKLQLKTLIYDAVEEYFKTKTEGLYNAEYISVYLHKVKSGKVVITIYNNIEI